MSSNEYKYGKKSFKYSELNIFGRNFNLVEIFAFTLLFMNEM